MYCPNCGNKVSENDNFCAACGKNLRNVHIKIEKDNSNHVSKNKTKSSQETRVFKPEYIDKIDTTDDIKNIIAEVDKRISKNIADYETGSAGLYSNDNENHSGEKHSKNVSKPKTKRKDSDSDNRSENINLDTKIKDEYKEKKYNKNLNSSQSSNNNKNNVSNLKKSSNDKLNDNFQISQKELIKRVQEELKKSNYQESFEDKSTTTNSDYIEDTSTNSKDKPKKFSFKEKWKSFINEDDDEFSIFSSINNEDDDAKNKKNIEVSKSTDIESKSFENTLETPKIELKDLEDYEAKKSTGEKHNTTRPLSKVKKSTDKDFYEEKSPISSKTSANKKNLKNSSSNFFNKFKNKKHSKNSINNKKKLSDTVGSYDVEPKDTSKHEYKTKSDNKDFNKTLKPIINKLSSLDIILSNYINEIGSKESKIILGIGILLTAIQIIIGQFGFNFAIIISILLKLGFDYFEFYVPLNISIDRDDMNVTQQEIKKSALINWIICKVFLFVAFIISPFGGLFKYNLLSALTPMPLATVILIILSLLIALTQFRDEFENRSSINFVGWYALTFILFELLFKMIWFLINFIFVTLL